MRYGEKIHVNLSMSQDGEGWKGPMVGHLVLLMWLSVLKMSLFSSEKPKNILVTFALQEEVSLAPTYHVSLKHGRQLEKL